jgi:diacylglycerol kinase family enzyme
MRPNQNSDPEIADGSLSDQSIAGMSIIISVNPNSGSTDRTSLVEDIRQRLVDANFDVDVLTDVTRVVKRAGELSASGKLRTVVSAGGDGTASLLANRLPQGIPLAILPLGTENLLARHLGMSADAKQFVDVIINGRYQKMDAGSANGKLFLVMAGCGFDAHVVEKLHQNRKGHISYWSWFRPVLSTLRRYRYPELQISVERRSDEKGGQEQLETKETLTSTSARWAFIFNAPRYAMNLPLLPEADPYDGALDLCSFRYGGLVRGTVYLVAVVLRKHRQWCETEFCKFRKLTISSNSRVPFQLDGDPGGELPVTIEVLPNYLTLLVPGKQAT